MSTNVKVRSGPRGSKAIAGAALALAFGLGSFGTAAYATTAGSSTTADDSTGLVPVVDMVPNTSAAAPDTSMSTDPLPATTPLAVKSAATPTAPAGVDKTALVAIGLFFTAIGLALVYISMSDSNRALGLAPTGSSS